MIGQGEGFVNHLAEQRQIIDSPIHSGAVEVVQDWDCR